MKIPKWPDHTGQMSKIGRFHWSVARLIELTRNHEVMEVPLNHLNLWHKYEGLTLREMVMHFKAVQEADLTKPIIMDEDGEIMDGRHRLMKAMLTGQESILAVRFEENPSPCKIDD